MADVDSAVDRLVLIDLLVGFVVMAAIAVVGVWVIRVSLRPLVQIEQTAAAIARGDLTRRVPELNARTEVGQLSTSLNTMLAQIEAAFMARAASENRAVRSEERMRQFVADASHELRTPLTTIRGFAELYRQGAAPDPADVLRRIEDEAARMGLLVEDLLLLARLDEERPLQLAPVALVDLIEDAAQAAHAVAPERPVAVDIEQPAERLLVSGDEARLRQVVANLVTNALTHTPEGTPVSLRLRADGDQYAVIEVSDQGPGLTPEQSERVFERFYRVDKARTRRAATLATAVNGLSAAHSGTGLGLAIVAALVAAHAGTVEVETAPGQGAAFRVRLPLAVPQYQDQ
jgi:two-component system OmpR family sensor kinase